MTGSAVLARLIAGACTNVTVADDESVTGLPVGGCPVTVAVLSICPAFTSAAVVTCVAVHVIDSPTANEGFGQVIAPSLLSDSVTAESGTFPELVTL